MPPIKGQPVVATRLCSFRLDDLSNRTRQAPEAPAGVAGHDEARQAEPIPFLIALPPQFARGAAGAVADQPGIRHLAPG